MPSQETTQTLNKVSHILHMNIKIANNISYATMTQLVVSKMHYTLHTSFLSRISLMNKKDEHTCMKMSSTIFCSCQH